MSADLERANLAEANLDAADLRGATLREAILKDARIREANLQSTNLEAADLRGVDFRLTDLGGATLSKADLSGASLRLADLRQAQLQMTNLSRAGLQDCHLKSTNLEGAVLRQVILSGTTLSDINLCQIEGLREARHLGPSTIGTDTLEATAIALARSPERRNGIEEFLVAAGVSNLFIRRISSIADLPFELYSSFISYSHSDKAFSRHLRDRLQSHGVRCWLDEHDLKPGDRILDVVDDAIRIHDKILLCCSEASLNSWWVKDEIRKAMERERREGRDIIIPVMVDRYLLDEWEDGLAPVLRSRLAADFTGWEHNDAKFEEQFERIVQVLRTERNPDPDPRL